MYAGTADFLGDRLVQGDIVGDIQVVGAINLRGILWHTPAAGEGVASAWTVPAEPKFGHAMVVSHSCEIATENGVKLTSVILAPLRDLSGATAPERVAELIESNLVDTSGRDWSYLKYFYLEPNPLLQFPSGAVVDFSKLFSVRKQTYQHLLERKRLQLLPEPRIRPHRPPHPAARPSRHQR